MKRATAGTMNAMPIDSFRYLPRVLAEYYRLSLHEMEEKERVIPWTALPRPIQACRVALLTSGGLYRPTIDEPFDLEGERKNPRWGDPSFRMLPSMLLPGEVDVAHLHINPNDLRADFNILLPVTRAKELAALGEIGSLAETAYSFMGYQGFPPDTSAWETIYAPQVVTRLKQESVDCIILTPA